jgi:glycosyltransferase involved in cell wall biosynthesis
MKNSNKKDLISIIVPCYNEEESIPLFYEEMCKIMEEMKPMVDFEIIFVDDGSRDKTLMLSRELSQRDQRVKYVSLSRNFGKESAMYAGLRKSKGDFVATMDVDLQDPPSLLPDMYRDLKDESLDWDCIGTRRVTRKGEPPVRSFFARCFYKFINKISKTEFVDGARDFRLMKRQMVDAVLSMGEYNRFSKGIFGWVGFKTKWLEYENIERIAGTTKWSFWSLLKYSFEGIISFSTAPLLLPMIFGFLFCFFSFGLFIVQLTMLALGAPLGMIWTVINVVSLLAGVQLICLGFVCAYLARMYFEIKARPIFITREESIEEKETPNE